MDGTKRLERTAILWQGKRRENTIGKHTVVKTHTQTNEDIKKYYIPDWSWRGREGFLNSLLALANIGGQSLKWKLNGRKVT